ncbi:MAG: hypothetical protein ACRDNL_01935 [Spirillospora sp.]
MPRALLLGRGWCLGWGVFSLVWLFGVLCAVVFFGVLGGGVGELDVPGALRGSGSGLVGRLVVCVLLRFGDDGGAAADGDVRPGQGDVLRDAELGGVGAGGLVLVGALFRRVRRLRWIRRLRLVCGGVLVR